MASRNESGKAFFHLLLSRKVVYVEEALSWFNDRQEEMDRPTCGSVEEFCENLQSYFAQLANYGYKIKMSFNPLDMGPRQRGKFFCIINTIKDKAVQEAPVLTRRREITFFNAIIEDLLQPDTEEGGEAVENEYIAKVLSVASLRNARWLRSIAEEGDKTPLLPRDIDRLLAKLDEEKWLAITKTSVDDQRAVWFGPRAIAELPAVDQELRRRHRAGAALPTWEATPRGTRYPVVARKGSTSRSAARSSRQRASQSQSQQRLRTPDSGPDTSQPGPARRGRSQPGSSSAHANGRTAAEESPDRTQGSSRGSRRLSRFVDSEDDSPQRSQRGRYASQGSAKSAGRRTRRRLNVDESDDEIQPLH